MMKKVVKCIIKILFLLTELLGFVYFFSMYFEDFVKEKLLAGSLAATAFLMCIVSGYSIYGVVKEKKNAFLGSILLNVGVFFAGASVAFLDSHFEDGIYATGLFGFVAVIMFAIVLVLHFRPAKNKGNAATMLHNEFQKRFQDYKAKWVYDAAASEYVERFGIPSVQELSDEQTEKIYEYASMPVIYLLEWLVRNDFISEELNEGAEAVKNGTQSIMDFFMSMDYCLVEEDIKPEIIRFLNYYFQDASRREYYGRESERFFFDYYEVVKNQNGFVYCVDYSEEDYAKLSEIISSRFRKFYDYSNDLTYVDGFEDDAFWARFNVYLEVRAYVDSLKPFDNALIRRCEEALNDLPDETVTEMFKAFDELWNISEILGVSWSDLPESEYCSRILNMISFDDIVIFPEDATKELGFAVTGSAEFEEEHGISATFRGGRLVSVGYQMDYLNPYSAEADEILELKDNLHALKMYKLNSKEAVESLANEGNVLGKIVLDNETYYMSRKAINVINACLMKLETLKAFEVIDKVEYKAQYDSTSSIVPRFLLIHGYCDDKKIFGDTARNW